MEIDKQSSNLALPGIVVLIAIAWGIVMSPVSLDSPRPVQPVEWSSFESIPARLWEDPLRAVSRARTKIQGKPDGLPEVRMSLGEGRQALVLTVLIPGAPYFEQQEHRMRTRYAILSALGAQGFSPSRGDSISYFGACLLPPGVEGSPPSRDCSAEKGIELAVPFEWFRKENAAQGDPFGRVLLLWADESRLGEDPLGSLHQILHGQLLEGKDPPGHLAFSIIGPTSSTTIHRYAVGQTAPENDPNHPASVHECSTRCPLKGIRVLSPWSTVKWDKAKFPSHLPYGIDFHPVIGTDDQLLRLIVRELELRNAQPRGNGPLAVIVSEWDTIYGRRMQETFEEAYQEVCLADHWGIDCQKGIESIRRVSYLRGIDGKTALVEERKKDGSGNSEEDEPGAFVERPEGPSQLDYLRRLPRHLKNLVADEGRPIRAIGVLGSDVYDKLLILKALRQEFPKAVFFTTDLDSRLLHPSELGWTRNLIVASQFGLGLVDDLAAGPPQQVSLEQQVAAMVGTRRIPRFRDNYQTANLLAALTALMPQAELEKMFHPRQEQSAAPPSHPRIYEIGRHSPVLLNPSRLQHCPWGQKWTVSLLFIATLACAFAQLGGSAGSSPASRSSNGNGVEATLGGLLRIAAARLGELAALTLKPLLPALAIFLALALVAFFDSNRPGGEPWTLFEGVSLWTTEFLLAGLILLCAAFAARMRSQLNLAAADIDREIFRQKPSLDPSQREGAAGGDGADEAVSRQSAWERFKPKALKELHRIQFRFPRQMGQQTQARAVWEDYKERISPHTQAVRIFFYLIPVAVLCSIQLYIVPPRTFRGTLSWGVDLTLLVVSSFVLYLVIVFVLDLSIMTSLLTRRLSLMDSQWPDKTLAHFAGKEWGGMEGQENGPSQADAGQESERGCPNLEDLCGRKLNETLSEWLDIQLISRLTQTTDQFIYYPFVVALLFALAHHSIFDHWVIGAQELLQLILALAVACIPPILIRRTAEQARQQASQSIEHKIMRARSSEGGSARIDLLKDCLGDVRTLSLGAFSPLTQNPVLRAVLIPFGGLGGLALLESLIQ